MAGARTPVEGVDVEALAREARAVLLGDEHHAPGAAEADAARGGATAVAALRDLILKDPHRIDVKQDYHVLRAVISGCWGPREPSSEVAGAAGGGGLRVADSQALLLALVLAARLPLDGLLLAAQALYHALADRHVQALLQALAAAPGRWKDAAVLALHHGLLVSAVGLVPSPEGDDDAGGASAARRPGQLSAAGPDLRAAVVEAVERGTVRVTLRECRATSNRTKAAFKMLHAFLCTMARWRRVPADLEEIAMLVSTSWEVPLPGVRDCNEAVLVQLQDLALRSAGWPRSRPCETSPAEAAVLERLRDPEAHWSAVLHGASWRAKEKYLLLKVLAPRLGQAALLRDMEAVLVDGLLLGMADPHLASAATAVYRVVLGSLQPEHWHGLCLRPVVAVLTGSDRKLTVNVLNYWVGPTIKAFPDALQTLLDALKGPAMLAMDSRTTASYAHAAYLHLLKVGRKEGLWDAEDDVPEVEEYWSALERGLRHGDAWARGLALGAVCVSARPRRAVGARELAAARRFLAANVRSDDSRLRHALLEALGWLLMRLRNSLRPLLARPGAGGGDAEANADLAAAARFLGGLHRFVLDGLQPGANYQRRVTCLGLYRLMLGYLAAEPARPCGRGAGLKKGVNREALPRSAVLARHLRLGSAASRRVLLNCIMDPADDVRAKAAEVLGMLPDDDGPGEESPPCLPSWKHVTALCNSPLFFQAESGAVLGSVLCSWNEGVVEPLALVAECERQLSDLRGDVLAAAAGGSPLHGVLGLVRRLLRLLPLGPHGGSGAGGGMRLPGRWAGTESRLLRLLEDNVDLCLNLLASRAAADSAFAPSFAEMGEAIDSMVSRAEGDDEALPLTLSPAHQLVLNCIWLNLKASCALACDLVEVDWPGLGLDGAQRQDFAERCARLPVAVLTRCRHKGAIEAAGTTLQQVVKTLTEQSSPGLRQLPHKLLTEFMHLLLKGSTAKGTSVSRRSAGMAILVHRIVLGDQLPDKPLLHECISCLFELLDYNLNQPASQAALSESQHDLPQTQALHFLRTLIADATLRVALSPYMCQAALICFRHLTSPVWSIRNASLQLFGALVPKIVGQGKSTGDAEEEDDTLVGCISFGDLLVRFNPLCNLLLQILETAPASGNVLKHHAELIPALSLLARLSVSEVTSWSLGEVKCAKSAFLKLLSSPISVVRSLAAKAFSRFTPLVDSANAFEELVGILLRQNTENGRYGALTAMKLIKDHLLTEGQLTQAADPEQERIHDLIAKKLQSNAWKLTSYASQAIVLSLVEPQHNFDNIENSLKTLHQISSEGRTHVGIIHWVATNMKQIVTNCSMEMLPTVLDNSLNLFSCDDIPRIAIFHVMRRLDEITAFHVMQEILNVCLKQIILRQALSTYETFHLLSVILKVIVTARDRQMSLVCDASEIIQMSQEFCSSKFGTRCEAAALPVLTGLLMFSSAQMKGSENLYYVNKRSGIQHDEVLWKIVSILEAYSQPDKDEDYRLAAAIALRFIGATLIFQISQNKETNFGCLSETATVVLDTAVRLLQDEDSHVREEASKFVTDFSQGVSDSLNSLECIEALLTHEFLGSFLGSELEVTKFLWKFLSLKDISYCALKDNNIENPFDHGCKNIFAEKLWVIEHSVRSLKNMFKQSQSGTNFQLACGELTLRCREIQETLANLEAFQHNANGDKAAVLEEWQARALCLQLKKMDYRLQIFTSVFVNEEVLLKTLSLQIKSYISHFSFYV